MSTAATATKSAEWTASLHCDDLKVNGQITFPTTGYTVSLKRKVPQGINPKILLLEKVVVPPTGVVADHVVNQPVSFEEHTTTHYQEVEILPDGIRIMVKQS
jgi:hypothetical protein